jgi:hypothetical protein
MKPQQPVHTGHQQSQYMTKNNQFCLQVTHKNIRSSLKMVHGCRNM